MENNRQFYALSESIYGAQIQTGRVRVVSSQSLFEPKVQGENPQENSEISGLDTVLEIKFPSGVNCSANFQIGTQSLLVSGCVDGGIYVYD